MKFSRIVLFGAGNLAFHLGKALHKSGYQIIQVYSRTEASAQALAREVKAVAITNPSDFDDSADSIIFAIDDNVLEDTINKIDISGQLALHTSGSISIDVFKGKAEHYGVLYPLQTFSKYRKIDFYDVPLFIESNSPSDLINLKMLATSIAAKVTLADSLQRKKLHLAAVFASNFVNHMYALSLELAKKSGYSFEIFKPIILETALKAIELGNPLAAQTGPAIRKNKEIIREHIEMLNNEREWQNLYTFITNSIIKLHQPSAPIL
jgi:predicted short-subunit dehydrogenase-like oxidoreductase (DUF2520 family)